MALAEGSVEGLLFTPAAHNSGFKQLNAHVSSEFDQTFAIK